jgi:hypothetical protein
MDIKLKGLNFDTFELIESESQAVLNTHMEHGFQDAFKNGRSAGNGAYARKGTTSKAMVASRPKVSFYQSRKLCWLFVHVIKCACLEHSKFPKRKTVFDFDCYVSCD